MRSELGGPLHAHMSGGCKCWNPSVSALLLVHPGTNRQIHEDLGVPLFADHIRALTASLDVENLLVLHLGRCLR